MFNILFKNKSFAQKPVTNESNKTELFFLALKEANNLGSDKSNKQTKAKKAVKTQNKTNKSINTIFSSKAQARVENAKIVHLDTPVEVKESWLDTDDMGKFRDIARGLIASRPTKLL